MPGVRNGSLKVGLSGFPDLWPWCLQCTEYSHATMARLGITMKATRRHGVVHGNLFLNSCPVPYWYLSPVESRHLVGKNRDGHIRPDASANATLACPEKVVACNRASANRHPYLLMSKGPATVEKQQHRRTQELCLLARTVLYGVRVQRPTN